MGDFSFRLYTVHTVRPACKVHGCKFSPHVRSVLGCTIICYHQEADLVVSDVTGIGVMANAMQKLDGGVAGISAAGFDEEELEELWSVAEIKVRPRWTALKNPYLSPSPILRLSTGQSVR